MFTDRHLHCFQTLATAKNVAMDIPLAMLFCTCELVCGMHFQKGTCWIEKLHAFKMTDNLKHSLEILFTLTIM